MRWELDPIIAAWPPLELRYYTLLFGCGLWLAWRAGRRHFPRFELPPGDALPVLLWSSVGMLVGAHYLHLAFYEPHGFSDLRFGWDEERQSWVIGRFWNLGSGLASHGGALGAIAGLYLFWRWKKKPSGISFWRYADASILASVWVYPFVRLGNFFNSELVGRPSNLPWAVVFARYDAIPRHPVQLYEAILYSFEIALAEWLAQRRCASLPEGVCFGGILSLHFTLRFVCEFFKEAQGVDQDWSLTMGQWLSFPMVFGGGSVAFLRWLMEKEKSAAHKYRLSEEKNEAGYHRH
ncbi:MAG: prolipoprotein diacylglyceryl transferase [Sandaracinaceae bacterium]|nr:prolipoprotein diacylglyceryl transferase [Sandaracinaceae bacterium]